MNPSHNNPPHWLERGHIPSLDGLRAVAVLLVVFAHAHQTQGFPDLPGIRAFGHRAAVGVDVFFVISGFLITTLMLREKDRTGKLAVGSFYLRRLLRIVPAYAAFLTVVALLTIFGVAHVTARDWTAALTWTVNFVRTPAWEVGHAWSLSIEEHFYLLWPLMMASSVVLSRRAALACPVFCFVARWVILLAFPTQSPMTDLWTFTRLDSISAGCLLAYAARDNGWREWLDSFAANGWLVLAALGGLLGSLALGGYAKFAVGFGYSLNAACLALLLWAAVRRSDSWVGRALNVRGLRFIGVMSYSLYLWQQLFLNPRAAGFAQTFPQNIALAFLAAFVSYHCIELPFLALKPSPAASPDAENLGSPCLAGAPEEFTDQIRAVLAETRPSAVRRPPECVAPLASGVGPLPG